MEKTLYIVSRLALIAIFTAAVAMTVYAIGIIGKAYGMEPNHIVVAIIGTMVTAMLAFWLAGDYDLKKLHDSRKD